MAGTIVAQDADRPGAAALAILAAMALIGVIDTLVPMIAAEAGLWQFHAIRSAMALAVLWVAARAFGWRLRPRRWGGVMARSAAIAVAMVLYFGALAVLPIGQTVAGLFTAPIWVLGISVVLLGFRAGPVHMLAVFMGFAGVVLTIGPGGTGISVLALVPVLAGAFYAVGQIGTRAWCADEDAATMLFWFFAVLGGMACLGLAGVSLLPEAVREAAPAQAAFVLRPWGTPSPLFLLLTAAQAFGSLIAVGLIIKGYQLAEASRVAVYENSLLVFASFFAWLLFGQVVTPVAALGMALIVLAALAIAQAARGSPGAPA